MAWTPVVKPVGPTYTNVNPIGKEQYDQFDITYDSSTTFYDGVDPSQWTDVNKPSTPTWNNVAKPV